MWVGLLTDRINNKLERSNLINEHALNREPVPLKKQFTLWDYQSHSPKIFLDQAPYEF